MNDVMQDLGRLRVGDFVIASFDRTEGRNPRKWTEAGELLAKAYSSMDPYGYRTDQAVLVLRSTIDGSDQVVRSSDGSPGGWLVGLILIDLAAFGYRKDQRLEYVAEAEKALAELNDARRLVREADRRLHIASEAYVEQKRRLDLYDGKKV